MTKKIKSDFSREIFDVLSDSQVNDEDLYVYKSY